MSLVPSGDRNVPSKIVRSEEVVIPKDLQEFLGDIADERHGFRLGDPWKYSEDALAVVVPILRAKAPERLYKTMYEELKDLGMKDTGNIDKVALQNKTGVPLFIRAGTIFTGSTQNRAAENSTVVQPGKSEVNVRCVNQTHGINGGAGMKYGDIAPVNVTMNLISHAGQTAVWNSVRNYTSGHKEYTVIGGSSYGNSYHAESPLEYHNTGDSFYGCFSDPVSYVGKIGRSARGSSMGSVNDNAGCYFNSTVTDGLVGHSWDNPGSGGSSDLLGYMNKVDAGRDVVNDMLQKVPLFEDQVGAIVFSPVGVIAIESFEHQMSWAAIKKEVIEKHGDKICNEQADHLFELRPEKILPAFKKFVKGLENGEEHSVRRDDLSETRVVVGKGVIGEYTLVKGRVIHTIIVRQEDN